MKSVTEPAWSLCVRWSKGTLSVEHSWDPLFAQPGSISLSSARERCRQALEHFVHSHLPTWPMKFPGWRLAVTWVSSSCTTATCSHRPRPCTAPAACGSPVVCTCFSRPLPILERHPLQAKRGFAFPFQNWFEQPDSPRRPGAALPMPSTPNGLALTPWAWRWSLIVLCHWLYIHVDLQLPLTEAP